MFQIDIDKYEIISFDIFDTLIKRKYVQPKDLFEHLGKIIADSSFADKRIKAEIKARRQITAQDITLDEIYAQLPREYAKLKEEEKQLEINNTFANQEIKAIYDKVLKLNKKIIAVSDMYLDKQTITALLNRAGYPHFDKIYISGEYRKTKWSGDLYNIVLQDLKVEPQKILHVGDNYKADYMVARKKGINAVYYQEKTFLKDKKFTKFYFKGKELEKSCLFSLCNEYYKKTDDYFKKLGFTYGGPLCLAFIEWLYPLLKENKISDVLFVSRDGWILKKVFDILYPDNEFKTHYIYASREICKNVDFQEYKKYLEKQNIKGKKVALIDIITEKYTAHKFLQQFFKENLIAFYFRIVNKIPTFFSYQFEKDMKVYNWPFIEFLITAPEDPAKNIINEKVVFEENDEFENIRKNIYFKISEGICDFIKEYKKVYTGKCIRLSNDFVITWVNKLWINLSKQDVSILSTIYCTSDHKFKEYFPLITKKFYLLCKITCFFPFISLKADHYTVEILFFNKIVILKRVITKYCKTFYFLKIPIFSYNIN